MCKKYPIKNSHVYLKAPKENRSPKSIQIADKTYLTTLTYKFASLFIYISTILEQKGV